MKVMFILDFLKYICACVCVLLGMGGQNDKVHLKTFELFRIIQKKKIL